MVDNRTVSIELHGSIALEECGACPGRLASTMSALIVEFARVDPLAKPVDLVGRSRRRARSSAVNLVPTLLAYARLPSPTGTGEVQRAEASTATAGRSEAEDDEVPREVGADPEPRRRATGTVGRVGTLRPHALEAARAGLAVMACLCVAFGARADPIAPGVSNLIAAQGPDGAWASPVVRGATATSEALRALSTFDAGAAQRSAAVARLEQRPV